MSQKLKTALIALLILIAGMLFVLGAYSWFLNKRGRVEAGTARPTFPYSDYSFEELNKLYPQFVNENVTTTQTPEQTHRIFVDNLKKGDLNEAVECCFVKEEWADMKSGLQRVKEKGELNAMVADLDTEIRNDLNYKLNKDASATYFYSSDRGGKQIGSSIDFIKSTKGIWLIKSL